MQHAPTDKQEAILDATLELIGERGFHGAPISAIAKRAGVGAGTIYRYWKSKEELIDALYAREKLLQNKEIMDGVHAGLTVKDAFGLIFHNFFKTRRNSASRTSFLDQYYNSPYIGSASSRVREQLMAEYSEIVDRGIREGVLREQPLVIILCLLFGPVSQLALMAQISDIAVDNSFVDQTFEAVWQSIATEP